MNEPPDKPPDKVEQYGDCFAEYRRMRDSRGEEHLLVTIRRDTPQPDDTLRLRKFSIDMDTLERFASYEVPKENLSKPFDPKKPDWKWSRKRNPPWSHKRDPPRSSK